MASKATLAKHLALPLSGALAASVLYCSSSFAQDVRSIAMGGATVTSGIGVGGFVSNPALLMEAQRREQKFHFRFGGYLTVRDNVDARGLYDDNEDLLDNINTEINALTGQTISCLPPVDESAVCLSGTQDLGEYAGQTLDLFEQVNGVPVDGRVGGDLGFAMTSTWIPFSINLGARATAAGVANISEADLEYAHNLNDTLSDDTLTLGEINNTPTIELAVSGQNISVELPDDVLTSQARTSYLLRTQLAVGLARSFNIANQTVDVGITPKFSSLQAASELTDITDLNDDGFELDKKLEETEVTESSFTLDVGATMSLASNGKIRLGGVVRNLAPESIKTKDGYEFETTPQLVGSAIYDTSLFRVTGDLALNEAKQDNFATQRLNLGAELSIGFFDLRGGVQHELAVDENPTDFTLGVGLGFLDLAVALTGSEVKGGGLQIAFSL